MVKQDNYPVGFYFELMVKGELTAFQEVSGISKVVSLEEVVVGGDENRFKYRLPTTGNNQNLVLKRGLISKSSTLMNWCVSTLNDGLASPIKTEEVSVNLLDAEGQIQMSWKFFNAYPVKYSVSELTSDEGYLIMEELEFAYSYFEISSDPSFSDLFDSE